MNYPSEFSLEARDRIETEKIEAYRQLLPSRVYDSNELDSAIRCIMRIFLAFAKEACAIRKERGWAIERVQCEAKQFLRHLKIMVFSDKFPGIDPKTIEQRFDRHRTGSPKQLSLDDILKMPRDQGLLNRHLQMLGLFPNRFDVECRIKESGEWNEYEELLLATPVAATTTESTPTSAQPVVQRENLEGEPAHDVKMRSSSLQPTREVIESHRPEEPKAEQPRVRVRTADLTMIERRRAIVRENPRVRASGLCVLFDSENISMPKSVEAKSWESAYKAQQYRHRIDSLISRDRKAT
jgi:hypothetical protein